MPLTKSLRTQLDGNYTRMLRAALDVSWRSHISNKELYGPLTQVSAVVRSRRLRLTGHVVRHEEMAGLALGAKRAAQAWPPFGHTQEADA